MENEIHLPHNDLLEESIIGTMLSDSNSSSLIREYIVDDCFFNVTYRELFQTFCRIEDRGEDPTIFNIPSECSVPLEKILDTMTKCIISGLRESCLQLQRLYKLRRLIYLAEDVKGKAMEATANPEEIITQVGDVVTSVAENSTSDVFNKDDLIGLISAKIRDHYNGIGIGEGQTLTGFKYLDDMGGFRGGDLIVLAANTSQGKTSLANAITLNALTHGGKIAVYSMEMIKDQLVARMLSMQSGVSSSKILNERLSPQEYQRVDEAMGEFIKFSGDIYVDDRSTSNADTILSSIRAMKMRYNINGAIVDYLNILNVNAGSNANKEQEMASVARRLKNIAKQLDIWILALAQISRSDEREPDMSHIRDSGQIAEAADIVLLIYRPEEYGKRYAGEFKDVDTRGTALIKISKGRNIGTGKFICGFQPETTLFYDLQELPKFYTNEEESF